MKILVTCQPGAGHFNLLRPFARAAGAAGHELLFAVAKSFVPKVEAAGHRAVAVGLDWLQENARETFPNLELAWRPGGFAYEDVFAGPTAERSIPDLLRLIASWSPDIVVREAWEVGGCLAAEAAGLPHVTAGANGFIRPDILQKMIGHYLDAHRVKLGLPPDPTLQMLHRYLDLVMLPPGWHLGGKEVVPPVTHFFRPELPAGDDEVPPWLEALGADPIVHVTLGTVGFGDSYVEVLREAIAALGGEKLRIVVSSGAVSPDVFDAPSNVHVERRVSHAMLLPRCALVIGHGGISTTMAALTFGKPMVLVPMAGDQPFTARVCEAKGVARVLPPNARSRDDIRSAVHSVLADASYGEKARALALVMKDLPPVAAMVPLVERVAATRAPIVFTS